MPYTCTVVSVRGPLLVLHVVPEQADCEPFYLRDDFALALLLGGEKSSALSNALGEDAVEALAAETADPSPFIAGLSVSVERQGSLRDNAAPIARYAIEVTDRKWLAHLRVGDRFESHAWSESAGPLLAEKELWEPSVRLAVGRFDPGDRVHVHAELPIVLGAVLGRGTIEEVTVASRAPTWWQGGRTVARVAFDHGPVAWSFAESLRRVGADDYERAHADPVAFFSKLSALTPLERARRLHFLALRGGASFKLLPELGRTFTMSIVGYAPRLFALLRKLRLERAIAIGAGLVSDWLADTTSRTKRFGQNKAGEGLARGDTIEDYQFECYAPMALTLGALTLLLAERPRHVDAELGRSLRRALVAVPTSLFGYPGWEELAAYPLEACGAMPPPLPAWLQAGHAPDAVEIGLRGAWVHPTEADLYRP